MNLKRLNMRQLLSLAKQAQAMAAALEPPPDPMEQAIEDRLFELEQEDREEDRRFVDANEASQMPDDGYTRLDLGPPNPDGLLF